VARFRFRFEAVLEHRRRQERDHQRIVAGLEARRRALEDRIRDCQGRLESERQDLRVDLLTGKRILDVRALRLQVSVAGAITARAQRLVIELAGVHARLDDARARLLEATTARKAVQRLRERELEAWRLREKRREARELDELSVMRAASREPA
jgi:flagellar export protein FliJ